MYLTFGEVTNERDKSKVQPADPIIYVRDHPNLGRVLTPDRTAIRRELGWGDPFAYGHLYYDADGRPCVVPDHWDEDDVRLAGMVLDHTIPEDASSSQ